ncbi:MAG: tetratricopeptide repeat protein [Pyrinomonadaceae bacterium]
MRSMLFGISLIAVFLLSSTSLGQIEELREATGQSVGLKEEIVYGRIILQGVQSGEKPPDVYVSLLTRTSVANRVKLSDTGYYYFRQETRGYGTIIVEVDGLEAAREHLSPAGGLQQRYDFTIIVRPKNPKAVSGVVSAKHAYVRSKDNARLLQKAAEFAEKSKWDKAAEHLTRLVANDPNDFIAWTLLGSVHYGALDFPAAENAYKTAIGLKPELSYTMLNLGKLHLAQKRFDDAIAILIKATTIDPASAEGFRTLGGAYLNARKWEEAIPAFNEAIRLEPVKMASCHVYLAWLYDGTGDKARAVAEYKTLLTKVPDHPDKVKFEQYLRDNPQ